MDHWRPLSQTLVITLVALLLAESMTPVTGFTALPHLSKQTSGSKLRHMQQSDCQFSTVRNETDTTITEEKDPLPVHRSVVRNETDITITEEKDPLPVHRSVVRNDPDTTITEEKDPLPVHKSVQSPAGLLCDHCKDHEKTNIHTPHTHSIPHRGQSRKRVLVLCTGGTLTMSNDPSKGNSLAPVQGALVRPGNGPCYSTKMYEC